MLQGDPGGEEDERPTSSETKPERISVMTLAVVGVGVGARRRGERARQREGAAPLLFVFMSSLPKSDETKCESGGGGGKALISL